MGHCVTLPSAPWDAPEPMCPIRAMRVSGMTKKAAAKQLGMSRTTFNRMLRKLGLFGGWRDGRAHNRFSADAHKARWRKA